MVYLRITPSVVLKFFTKCHEKLIICRLPVDKPILRIKIYENVQSWPFFNGILVFFKLRIGLFADGFIHKYILCLGNSFGNNSDPSHLMSKSKNFQGHSGRQEFCKIELPLVLPNKNHMF